MKIKSFSDLMKNELFIGSLILLIMLNIANIVNYLFHFFMARMLGPIDYGILAVLSSIIYIFNVPSMSIQTITSKYTTKFNSKKEKGKIKYLIGYLIKKLLIISLIFFALYSIICLFLTKSLNIPIIFLILTGVMMFAMFLTPITLGILQGTKKFKIWGWNSIISSISKIILAVILVWIGWKIYGAIIAWIIGTFISFFLVFPYIKEIMRETEIKEEISLFSRESLLTIFSMLFIVIIYSIDIILAKIFFTGDVAGKYAVASMIGKMILFASLAIGNAMFPISSEKFINKEKTHDLIKKTALGIVSICSIAVIIIWFLPEFVINLLFGAEYIEAANILIYVGIAFSFISFLNTYILYKISVNELKIKHIIYLAILLILQIISLSIFKNTVKEFAIAFMIFSILSLAFSLIFMKNKNGKKIR
jgi:O-antigen/teichoic acid export membrane protein